MIRLASSRLPAGPPSLTVVAWMHHAPKYRVRGSSGARFGTNVQAIIGQVAGRT
jgi:hypothetical protein